MQQNLYRLHKELVQLRREVLPLREVVAGLSRHHAQQGVLVGEYADLYDHVIRASESTESLRDLITAMFETHPVRTSRFPASATPSAWRWRPC